MVFRADPSLRTIDFDMTLTAVTKVTFGDAKDGVFSIRTAAVLQEDNTAGHGSENQLAHTGTRLVPGEHAQAERIRGKQAVAADVPARTPRVPGVIENRDPGFLPFDLAGIIGTAVSRSIPAVPFGSGIG